MKHTPLLFAFACTLLVSCASNQINRYSNDYANDNAVDIEASHNFPSSGIYKQTGNKENPGHQQIPVSYNTKSILWSYVTPNKDVLIAEAIMDSSNRLLTAQTNSHIILFRDEDGDAVPETKTVLIENPGNTFGALKVGDFLYIVTSSELLRYPYINGQLQVNDEPEIVSNLPGKSQRWRNNIAVSRDASKGFITVGCTSGCFRNGTHHASRQAAPGTFTKFTALSDKDEDGKTIVPQFLYSVKEGSFYGWQVMHDVSPFNSPNENSETESVAKDNPTNVVTGYKVVFVPFKKPIENNGSQGLLTRSPR